MLKKTLPNIITLIRLLGTIVLLFITPFTTLFFVIYSICGISDVLDGSLARLFHTESQFGAKLDSISDMLFYAVMLFRVFPALWELLPIYIWYIVIAIVGIRVVSYVTAACKYRQFASLHTYMNKLTGFALFCVPYVLRLPIAVGYCMMVCIISMLGSLEELVIHFLAKKHDSSVKTIFVLLKKKRAQQE